MKSPELLTRSEEPPPSVNPGLTSFKVERSPQDDNCSVGEDNLSSCSSTSSRSSAMGNSPHPRDAALSSSSSSPTTSLCGWCQKPGLKLFTLRTADGSKAFCSELCFTQCRRASFKKNKICNWCKHVRHTVNYVDYFDGKSQLQFCSTKCLGQYKMNILCREIELNSPRILQSLASSSSSSSLSPDSSVRSANQTENAAVAANTQFPVDLCTKRKARSQSEGGSGKHGDGLSDEESATVSAKFSRSTSQNANLALERSQILTPSSTKRHKSSRKLGEEHLKCGDPLRDVKSLSAELRNGHEHHLRLQQQIHLQQLHHQLQTRISLTPEIMFRSLHGKQAAVAAAAGHERLVSCGVRRERGHALPAPPAASADATAPFLHQHLPPGLPPPPPLHTHHHRFPPFRPTSSSSSSSTSSSLLLQQQQLSEGLPLTLHSEFLKPTRNSMKSEPSASSHQTSNRKRNEHKTSRSIETPAEELESTGTIGSRGPGHPRPPPPADTSPSQTSPSLVVPMPVVLPFPVPIPVPLFFFQQRALQRIEQLALELKQANSRQADRCQESADKSTQVDE